MSAEMVKEIVKRGWYVSFSGTVTFKNAEKVREACRAVPRDRLLIETDAPYLAPVPYRGKINNSILMQETCAVVAQVHRIGSDEIAEITYKNACDLFKI
jgi:TatD DNase family protein